MARFLANQSVFPVKHVVQFKENLRDLLISTLFIVLAARINLDQMIGLGRTGLAFVALLILLIRPLAVYASCLGSGLNWREKIFFRFLAPRGIVAAAVASVFALDVAHGAGEHTFHGADLIVPLTFLVIVGTVTTYGLASPVLARLFRTFLPQSPRSIVRRSVRVGLRCCVRCSRARVSRAAGGYQFSECVCRQTGKSTSSLCQRALGVRR